MFSLFQSKNEETSIIFDIGNGTLTGAIVVFNEDQKPKFVYTIKKNFSISEQLEPQQLELEMQKLLDEALNYIMKDGFNSKYLQNKSKKIKRVFISFSPAVHAPVPRRQLHPWDGQNSNPEPGCNPCLAANQTVLCAPRPRPPHSAPSSAPWR
jgi:hypothetical protein